MVAGLQGLSIEKLRSMPYGLAFATGRAMEFGARILRRKDDPPPSRPMVRMIGRPFKTSDAATRRELGYVGRMSKKDGLRLYREAAGVASPA